MFTSVVITKTSARLRPRAVGLVTCGAVVLMLTASLALGQDRPSVNRPDIQPRPDSTQGIGAALSDTRWTPWLGCWIPVESRLREDIQVCVLPTSDGVGVRMMTFASDRRILDELLVADGSRQPVKEDHCAGWLQSTWSRDGARVFRVTELNCDGKATQRTSGISTISGPGQWLDLHVAVIDGQESVRTRRYVRAADAPPAAIADDLRRIRVTRIAPLKTVTAEDVVEASAAVSPRAVEAWLTEGAARVPVNKQTLVRLADADVSRNVIDLLVAMAYPKHFEIHRPGSSSSFSSLSGFDDFGFWSDPWGFDINPYAYYYSPYGFYPGALDPYYLTIGGFTAIPSTSAPAAESGRGHVVNGSGYTQVEPRQPVVAPRTSGNSNSDSSGQRSSGGAFSSSSDGGSSSASPSGYSSGGSSDSGQTAVHR